MLCAPATSRASSITKHVSDHGPAAAFGTAARSARNDQTRGVTPGFVTTVVRALLLSTGRTQASKAVGSYPVGGLAFITTSATSPRKACIRAGTSPTAREQ